ncbi:MAG: sulfate permease [Burkholderiales bacterium]|nr:sulfate permease [Burkholderiales bacterium]
MPLLGWARGYSREDLSGDVVAGVITAILLVPQAMAFSLLAGLPPQAGLYASILPPIIYAVLGTSRTLAVGPVSVASIMVAQALAQAPTTTGHLTSALILALLGGALLIIFGLLRLGLLANFLSHPVLSGFTTAVAVVIILAQLPSLLGMHLPISWSVTQLPQLLTGLHWPTVILAAFAVALLWLSASPLARMLHALGMSARSARAASRTAPLVVVLASTLAVVALRLDGAHGVAVIGDLPTDLPTFGLSVPTWEVVAALLPSAALIAIVGYVESVSIAKTLASRRRQSIDPNQELIALGAANVGAAVSGGMPVAGGFSRTMVNHDAGARTQAAAIITALLVAAVVWLFAPLLAHVPKVALAAIIIVAVSRLIDVRTALAAWRYDRVDGAVLAATALGVLLLGIENGLVVGIVLSLLSYLWRASRPHFAELGRVPGSEHFRNVLRYTHLQTWPHILLLRVDEHLSFANTAYLEQVLMQRVAHKPQLEHLVLVCSGINGVDFSALEMLLRLAASLREAGITLHLAEVKGPVMDRLRDTVLMQELPPGRVFLSAHEAVETLAPRSAGECSVQVTPAA